MRVGLLIDVGPVPCGVGRCNRLALRLEDVGRHATLLERLTELQAHDRDALGGLQDVLHVLAAAHVQALKEQHSVPSSRRMATASRAQTLYFLMVTPAAA